MNNPDVPSKANEEYTTIAAWSYAQLAEIFSSAAPTCAHRRWRYTATDLPQLYSDLRLVADTDLTSKKALAVQRSLLNLAMYWATLLEVVQRIDDLSAKLDSQNKELLIDAIKAVVEQAVPELTRLATPRKRHSIIRLANVFLTRISTHLATPLRLIIAE